MTSFSGRGAVDGCFHFRQLVTHDCQHFEVAVAHLPGDLLTAGVPLVAFAFAFHIQRLLFIETGYDCLQAGFHFRSDVAGMLDLFQYSGWKQFNGRCLRRRLNGHRHQQQTRAHQLPEKFLLVFPVTNRCDFHCDASLQ
jgi:hypothetical protein